MLYDHVWKPVLYGQGTVNIFCIHVVLIRVYLSYIVQENTSHHPEQMIADII